MLWWVKKKNRVEKALLLTVPAGLDSKINPICVTVVEKSICNYVSICFSIFLPPFPSLLLPAIDLLYGGIYCFVCQDYIYDKDMEQIAKEEQRKAWKLQGMGFVFCRRTWCSFWNKATWYLSAITFLFLYIHRHRGEIHNMGTDQEGARIITTQSKAEENHYKLYHRWAIDCTAQSAQLSSQTVRVCSGDSLELCVCLYMCLWCKCTWGHSCI